MRDIVWSPVFAVPFGVGSGPASDPEKVRQAAAAARTPCRHQTALRRFRAALLKSSESQSAVTDAARAEIAEFEGERLAKSEGETAAQILCRECHLPLICEHELATAGLSGPELLAACHPFEGPRPSPWDLICRACGQHMARDYELYFTNDDPDKFGRSEDSRSLYAGSLAALEFLEFDISRIAPGDFAAQAAAIASDLLSDHASDLPPEDRDDGVRFIAFVICMLHASRAMVAGSRLVKLKNCPISKGDLAPQLQMCIARAVNSRFRALLNHLPRIFNLLKALSLAMQAPERNPLLPSTNPEVKLTYFLAAVANDPLVAYLRRYLSADSGALAKLTDVVDVSALISGNLLLNSKLLDLVQKLPAKVSLLQQTFREVISALFGKTAPAAKQRADEAKRAMLERSASRARPQTSVRFYSDLGGVKDFGKQGESLSTRERPVDLSVLLDEQGRVVFWDSLVYDSGVGPLPIAKSLQRPPNARVKDLYSSTSKISRMELRARAAGLTAKQQAKLFYPPKLRKTKVVPASMDALYGSWQATALGKHSTDQQRIGRLVAFAPHALVRILGTTEGASPSQLKIGHDATASLATNIRLAGYLARARMLAAGAIHGRPIASNLLAELQATQPDAMFELSKIKVPAREPQPLLEPEQLRGWLLEQLSDLCTQVGATPVGRRLISLVLASIIRSDSTLLRYSAERARSAGEIDGDRDEFFDDVPESSDVGKKAEFMQYSPWAGSSANRSEGWLVGEDRLQMPELYFAA